MRAPGPRAVLILACSAVLIAPLNAFLPGSPTAARVRASGTARGSTCFCHQLRCTSGEKPRTVGIIGGGPAGLVTALALLKLPTGVEQVTIFEQKSSGIQINGGAAILSRLGLQEEILAASNPLERVVSRNVDGTPLLDMHIPDLIRGLSAKPPLLRLIDVAAAARQELVAGDDSVLVFLIMRDKLQELLTAALPAGCVKFNKKLAAVSESADRCGVVCQFDDGETESFDLVVGCDGVKSKVRSEVVGPETAIYSGVRILFGIAPHSASGSRPQEIQREVHQWFGEGAYAFTASYGGAAGPMVDQIAIITADSSKAPENSEWGVSDRRAEMLGLLDEAKMPAELRATAERADRFFNIGVFLHNPLTPWSRGRMVLVGDAAHAMPPFLGQGANQAIQDGYCLASQLAQIGAEHETLSDALAAYQSIRQFPTAKLTFNSWFLGFIETQRGLGAAFRDKFFNTMYRLGVAQFVFLDGATPKVGSSPGGK